MKEAEEPTPGPKPTPGPSQEGKKTELYQQAIGQWQRTVSKYPGTESASRAQYEIGRLFETRLLKFEEAFDAYKQVTWGSYMAQAQERLRDHAGQTSDGADRTSLPQQRTPCVESDNPQYREPDLENV